MDILLDAVGSGLHHVGSLDVQLGAVGKESVGIELGDVHDGLILALGTLEHLILALVGIGGEMAHVGDVHNAMDIVAGVAHILLQHVLHEVGAEVTDMGKVVHGRAAGIQLHMTGGMGLEFFLFTGSRVIQVHSASPLYTLL